MGISQLPTSTLVSFVWQNFWLETSTVGSFWGLLFFFRFFPQVRNNQPTGHAGSSYWVVEGEGGGWSDEWITVGWGTGWGNWKKVLFQKWIDINSM